MSGIIEWLNSQHECGFTVCSYKDCECLVTPNEGTNDLPCDIDTEGATNNEILYDNDPALNDPNTHFQGNENGYQESPLNALGSLCVNAPQCALFTDLNELEKNGSNPVNPNTYKLRPPGMPKHKPRSNPPKLKLSHKNRSKTPANLSSKYQNLSKSANRSFATEVKLPLSKKDSSYKLNGDTHRRPSTNVKLFSLKARHERSLRFRHSSFLALTCPPSSS